MENTEDDEELKLAKASAGLLSNLEASLPKLLWKAAKHGGTAHCVHTRVKKKDLEYVIKLIEPFQGEPQLLDARLKHILPPIVDAYLEWLQLPVERSERPESHVGFQMAVCTILYTLCKVRGPKVIVGFFNNEPRHLESLLTTVEHTVVEGEIGKVDWHVSYILLMWLSHLLLTPFDLASISTEASTAEPGVEGLKLPTKLPSLARRVLIVGLKYLPSSTKAQDAAAAMIVRLVDRPDMQKLRLADSLVGDALRTLQVDASNASQTIYECLGSVRFLAGISISGDLGHLLPEIYRVCEKLANAEESGLSNAVVKKVLVKILRNIAIFSLRATSAQGPLLIFLETTSVLEDVIDYLLRSIGDRDTPVRYAAAKAMSLIVQELDPDMGHEVIQAVLDTFKEDMPRHGDPLDFRTADALKWHGLTLALAHALFKRTASPEQLPDIVRALGAALQFEQRTATGSSVGTNVRDAANFGIWALSRRYTTEELLAVDMSTLGLVSKPAAKQSVIQYLAIELILSACSDPAGNIRRGSSAALQELVGRHPNLVHEGIALVQIVEYQAVGLRRRAMVDVAHLAAELHQMYWRALVGAVMRWRGLGSADVLSREAAAGSLASLSLSQHASTDAGVLSTVTAQLEKTSPSNAEALHGLTLSLACIIEETANVPPTTRFHNDIRHIWSSLERLQLSVEDFSVRILRSELPAAIARLLSALCSSPSSSEPIPFNTLDTITDRLLARHEDTILQTIPPFVRALSTLKRRLATPLACLDAQILSKQIFIHVFKSTLNGAGRAIALGALVASYDGDKAAASVKILATLVTTMNVDWRIIGIRALTLVIKDSHTMSEGTFDLICQATHQGLNDYTIDERGDVGSLVRLRAIACASCIFSSTTRPNVEEAVKVLRNDILRLSLEKLDRVRMQAAQCRAQHFSFPVQITVTDIASVSFHGYFYSALSPLLLDDDSQQDPSIDIAILEGSISCAGLGAEPLLQASRAALTDILDAVSPTRLHDLMTAYTALLKTLLLTSTNTQAALETLAHILDMRISHRLSHFPPSSSTFQSPPIPFKWLNLLSALQRAHHKSNDIPKILAAVRCYRGLAEVETVRGEVLRKLCGMVGGNPYPRVRAAVAEVLWVVTGDEGLLKGVNFGAGGARGGRGKDVVGGIRGKVGG